MKSDIQYLIVNELRDFIIPLSDEELFLVENNILKEGCRDPLTIWENKGKLVIVDGHHRYKICQKHGLQFKIKKLHFDNIDDVRSWMVDNQMGRRNLTPDQISYYRGLKYISLKKKKGGYDNVKLKGQSESTTSEFRAYQFNVSESTIKRDYKFAEGLNIIGHSNPKLKTKILTGESKVNKSDIQALQSAKNPEKLTIKNEKDLFNKAKNIRKEILQDVETKVKKIEFDRVESAREILKSKEPDFLSQEDRLKKLKGMILSAMNRAINEKNASAIKDLKKLIDRLCEALL